MSQSNTAITLTVAILAGILGYGIGNYKSMHDGFATSENVSLQVRQLSVDSATLPIADTPIKGALSADMTIVAFMDFSSPATATLYRAIFDKAFRVHGDRVAVSYRAFPLEKNAESLFRAQAAAAAHKQNKFWEMADELVKLQGRPFDKNTALDIAKKLNLNMAQFNDDFDSREVREAIRRDIKLGEALNVTGVPAIFINTKPVRFAKNLSEDELMGALNAEAGRIDRLKSDPGYNYYVSSLINQQVSDKGMHDALGRPAKGTRNPLVTIVEYSDYQCPFCSRAEPTIRQLLEKYPDTVRVVFSHNPLPFHKDAKLAAQAAYAADLQGKFWEMHDILFKNQKALTEDNLVKYAKDLELNVDKFKADLKAKSTVDAIDKNLADANERGISGTPNFLINGEPLTGAQPLPKFVEAVDKALAKARDVQAKTGLTGEALYDEIMKSAPKPKPKAAPEPETKTFVDINGAPTMGDPNAPITIVEFTDFECPFCQKGYNTLNELLKNNPGKVKIVFKHNPLSFHKHADAAHRAAEAASLQGKFWEMYKQLFEHQKNLEQSDLEKYAAEIGLNIDKFKADMESDVVKSRIKADLSQGESVKVQGTPHFFMNGTRISGAQPIAKFQSILDEELKIADKYIKRGVPADNLYKTIIAEESAKMAKKVARPSDARPPVPGKPIVMNQGASMAKGPEDAPVVIYQFSEFQCPFCSRVEPSITQLLEAYPGKIRLVFKNFPLAFHADAPLASEAALAAGEQGKFWEMHEVLFKNQKNLKREALTEYAKQVGLDLDKFNAALDSHKFEEQVKKEIAEGQAAGVSGTPSFVINGKLVVGAQPFDTFKTEVEAALAAKK